jgi:NADPH2:quinone reductase
MRAMVATAPGGPEVLQLRELPDPQPRPGELTIDVAYAGVNFAEVQGRRGDSGPRPRPFVPGLEVAGRVRGLGEGVTEPAVGQPVCAFTDTGGYAEIATAPALLTFPLEGALATDLLDAACAPTIVPTAWSILRHAARLQPGESVLVHAAAGGLGTLVAQFARHLRAGTIVGTVGTPDKADYARGFGYDHVIDRRGFGAAVRELTDGRGVDLVVDSIGGEVREESLDALAPYGRVVACGNASRAPDVAAGAGRLMRANAGVIGYSVGWLSETHPADLRRASLEALDLLRFGAVRIDVTEVLDLDQAAEAHRRLESRASRGKLALRVGG